MVLGTIKERVGGKCRAALNIVIYLEVTTLTFCAQCDGLCYFYVDVSFQVQEVCLWVKERQRSSQDFFKKVVTTTKKKKKGNGKERKKTWIGNTHVISRCYGNPRGQEDIPEADDLIPKGEISHSSHSQPLLRAVSSLHVLVSVYASAWKVPVLISLISGKLNFLSFFYFLCLYVLKAQGDNVIYFPSDQGKKNLVFFM